jgi:hypothetical protein
MDLTWVNDAWRLTSLHREQALQQKMVWVLAVVFAVLVFSRVLGVARRAGTE